MDPVSLLPPEVVDLIWILLEPKDLLACRAVASHWLASVTSCHEAWVTDHSQSWHDFVEVKKTIRRWAVDKHRTNSFTKVKECVSTENAFYLLFLDGRLEMHSPCGNLVRTYENEAFDIHKGRNCLMIVVDRDNCERKSSFDTIITDFVLNEIEKLTDVRVLVATHNGFIFDKNGRRYFKFIERQELPVIPDSYLYFLDTYVVSSKCTSNNTVNITYFDVEEPNPSFKQLVKVVGTDIFPKNNILVGPRNFFIVREGVGINAFGKLYRGNFEMANYFIDVFHFFTKDYFVILNSYPNSYPIGLVLDLKYFDDDDYLLLPRDNMKGCEDGVTNVISSNPYFQNCVVRFHNQSDYSCKFCTNEHHENHKHAKVTTMIVCKILDSQKIELGKKSFVVDTDDFSWVQTPFMSLVGSNFFPSYSLKIQELDTTGTTPEKIIRLVHFDL